MHYRSVRVTWVKALGLRRYMKVLVSNFCNLDILILFILCFSEDNSLRSKRYLRGVRRSLAATHLSAHVMIACDLDRFWPTCQNIPPVNQPAKSTPPLSQL